MDTRALDLSEEREQYMRQLRQWVANAQKNNIVAFGAWCQYLADLQQNNGQIAPNQAIPNQNVIQNEIVVPATPGYYEYIIPPMWKRVTAELIDFLILIVIKMILTMIIMEFFDLFDIESYSLSTLNEQFKQPRLTVMSAEILMLEVLHRFIVFSYETYFLVSEDCATPGKKYMGLVVVQAENVGYIWGREQETVIAYPGTQLKLKNAVIRALFKNLFIGLLLPICCALIFFRFNRTGYDLLSSSLVVEYNPNPTDHDPH